MTTAPRRWLRRLTGPVGRRVLLALGLAAAWACWVRLPPRPLNAWSVPLEYGGLSYLAPDASTVVTVSNLTPRVSLWDTATGRELWRVAGADTDRWYTDATLAPDGSWLLTRNELGGLLLWDTATGRRTELQPECDRGQFQWDPAWAVSWDGRIIAALQSDLGAVRLWESATGRPLSVLDGARPPLAFTPDGRALLTATPAPDAKLWDLATGRELLHLPGHPSAVGAVAVSPDGRWLATGLPVRSRKGPYGTIATVVKLWEASSGRLAATIDVTVEAPQAWYLDFSPDSAFLVIHAWSSHNLLWDVTTDPPRNRDDLLSLTETTDQGNRYLNAYGPAFAPDGRSWWVSVEQGKALARAAPPDAPPRVVARLGARWQSATPPIFAPDGRTVAIAVLCPIDTSAVSPIVKKVREWLHNALGRPVSDSARWGFRLFAADTGHELAALAESDAGGISAVLGFTPDSRTLWTNRSILSPAGGRQVYEQWTVPTGWPPAWLLALMALGVLLAVADWRRKRRLHPRIASGATHPTPLRG